MPPSQDNRQISVKSALADDVLLFSSMTTSEQLGRLSEFRIQLLSTDSDIKIAAVLGQPMCIDVELTDGGVRHFHGIVTRFCSTGWSGEFARYEAIVHPSLWLLKKSSNCRIFQDMKVADIVKKVVSNYGGMVALQDRLTSDYPVLEYCVQYRETDFDFVCRLLEDAGIYFYFTHAQDSHTMVLVDSYSTHEPIDGYDALRFSNTTSSGGGLIEESISHWTASGEIQSSSYAMNDYNFKVSGKSISGGLKSISTIEAAFEQSAYEMYDYPGSYTNGDDGNLLAKARMERLHGQCEVIEARSDARGLFPGGLFTLAHHPRDDQNRKYLVTGARYQMSGGEYGSGGDAGTNVECRFTAIGHTFPYRPNAVIAKPVVQGPQTAIVVGKAGEEIYTDEFGRIKVHFHWDRYGKEDENSSCWVRVSQSWAGKSWGAMTIPRIGMEVVVSFLEGDPDRPLVTGCVYNSDAMPPYPLPANQTRSTFKTNSSKGGGGYNELRFEDKKGAEEIYIQAERDCNRVVKNNDTLKVGFEVAKAGNQTIDIKNNQDTTIGNDQTLTVGHDQTDHIKNDQFETIDNNQTLKVGVDCKRTIGSNEVVSIGADNTRTVGSNQAVKIGANSTVEIATNHTKTIGSNDSITVGANREVTIGTNHNVTIGSNQQTAIGGNQSADVGGSDTLTVGSSQSIDIGSSQTVSIGSSQSVSAGAGIKIEAMSSIELICGGSSIKIEPTKITISSLLVEIEAKGAMKIEATGAMKIDAGAVMKVSATGPMAISGAVVKIN